MAEIQPFRAVRYNPARFPKLDITVAQPYDQINDAMRENYYAMSEYNIARVTKSKPFDGDNDSSNVYTRAAEYYAAWRASGELMREENPCLYAYNQEYTTPDGATHVRHGFITALKLTGFDEGVVLPHERTLSGPKLDRLMLTRATGAHFGQIFILYPEQGNEVTALLDAGTAKPPTIDVHDEGGYRHKVWAIDDPGVIAKIQAAMADKRLFIADGHHRYETGLTYRDEMRAANPGDGPNAAYNYTMATMVSMSDPGLLILPTHREMHSIANMTATDVLEEAKAYFDIAECGDLDALLAAMAEAGKTGHILGFYDGGAFRMLTLRDESVMDQLVEADRAPEYKTLDVTILHSVLIEHILGLSKESVAKQENIRYVRDPKECVSDVQNGKAQFVFLMNPTKIEEVQSIAEKFERMPQKSTDFFPKLLTGLVVLPAGSGDVVP